MIFLNIHEPSHGLSYFNCLLILKPFRIYMLLYVALWLELFVTSCKHVLYINIRVYWIHFVNNLNISYENFAHKRKIIQQCVLGNFNCKSASCSKTLRSYICCTYNSYWQNKNDVRWLVYTCIFFSLCKPTWAKSIHVRRKL